MTRAAFSSTLRSENGIVLRKVSEVDFNGQEAVSYYRLTTLQGPRIITDKAEAEDAFDRATGLAVSRARQRPSRVPA